MKRKYNAPEVEIIQSQITSILAASEEGEFPGEGGAKAFNGFGDDEEENNSLTDYNAWNTWGDNENHDRL